MTPTTPAWFDTWFDSPYYHLLYQHRDDQEARAFVARLAEQLTFRPTDQILDLACGRGRHAIYLNQLGYDVMGVDLSRRNIARASWNANDRLRFRVHDMREVVKPEYFHYVLNLFTSFGYFEHDADNERTLRAAAASLRPGGRLVLDFMNTARVIENLVKEEEKTVQSITFRIRRFREDGFIVKDIRFRDEGRDYHFQERVRELYPADFMRYFEQAGLHEEHRFGDYHLHPFDEDRCCDRMIFQVVK